jgi:hypothetical protein
MDRGKRQGDRFRKVGAIWCTTNNANELAANYNHQHNNTTHQYIYYYQQTATRIPSTNESTTANQNTQSVGRNANAGGQCHRAAMTASPAAAQIDVEAFEAGLARTKIETGISTIVHPAAGMGGEIEFGTVCSTHGGFGEGSVAALVKARIIRRFTAAATNPCLKKFLMSSTSATRWSGKTRAARCIGLA